MPSLSAELASFASQLEYRDLPDAVRTHVRLLTMDALGCGLVGSTTVEVQRVRQSVQAMAGVGGDSVLWGTAARAPLPLAVMANSVAVHIREIDDFSLAYHAGSVVVPAAVGVAAAIGASGAELLAAIVAGYEASFRIAQGGAAEGVPGFLPFKKKGWHSTSLFGPFGAAVAAARLLRLDAKGMSSTIGVAGSCIGGTWAFNEEGNTIKRVHPGLASKSGVIAAFLAREGITGPSRILEAEWGGFYRTHLQGESHFPEHVTGRLGSDWQILNAGFKPYASCRRIHSPLDSLFSVVKKHQLRPAQVRSINVWGHDIHQRQLSRFPVGSVLEAQFSLPYTLAAALVSGSAGLDQYTEAALSRSDVAALARNISVRLDPSIPETGEPRVEFELVDGQLISETVHVPRGHPKNPLTAEEVEAKLLSNARLVLREHEVQALHSALREIDNLPDSGLLAKLTAASEGGTPSAAFD